MAVAERLRLTDALVRLQERIRTFVRDKLELGDASRLGLNLAQIAYIDALRERETIQNEQDQAYQALSRLLGSRHCTRSSSSGRASPSLTGPFF